MAGMEEARRSAHLSINAGLFQLISRLWWIYTICLLGEVCGFTLAENDRQRRAAADVTTTATTPPQEGTINKAFIIIPAIVGGIPVLICIFCILKSCCCKCESGVKEQPKELAWQKRQFRPRQAVAPCDEIPPKTAGDTGQQAQDYGAYGDQSYPGAEYEYSGYDQQGDGAYDAAYDTGQDVADWGGYNPPFDPQYGGPTDYPGGSESYPNSAGSGSKLCPDTEQLDEQPVPKRKSKKSKSKERY